MAADPPYVYANPIDDSQFEVAAEGLTVAQGRLNGDWDVRFSSPLTAEPIALNGDLNATDAAAKVVGWVQTYLEAHPDESPGARG